jgi:AraC-like DNA-binding protein
MAGVLENHDARGVGPPRGILRPGAAPFRLFRTAPPEDLAAWVEAFWIVRWDLRGQAPHTQENLPHPSVHVVVDPGGARVVGVPRGRFTRVLEGAGGALGTKFHPGAFRAFTDGPVSRLTGRDWAVSEVLGADPAPLERAVAAAGDDEGALVAAGVAFVRALAPAPDPSVAEVRAIVAAAEDAEVVRVEQLAARAGMGVRRLQRLFSEYVGVSPKWVIRRYRLLEAADRAAAGRVDWAALAADLGYYDQSHLVRDFTAMVGAPPARYARTAADPP